MSNLLCRIIKFISLLSTFYYRVINVWILSKFTICNSNIFFSFSLNLKEYGSIDVVRFLSINIYAPNEMNPQFFQDLFTQMEDSDTKVLAIGRRLEFSYGF